MPECPNCERHFSGGQCTECGWKPTAGPRRQPADAWDRQCQWNRQSAARCLLRPTVQEHPSAQYCGWHYCCSHDTRLANDFEEFERFCSDLLDRHYCTIWAHYRADLLWQWVNGRNNDINPDPTPCNQGGCAYRPVDPMPGTPKQILGAVKAMLEKLESTMTAPTGASGHAWRPWIDPAVRAAVDKGPR